MDGSLNLVADTIMSHPEIHIDRYTYRHIHINIFSKTIHCQSLILLRLSTLTTCRSILRMSIPENLTKTVNTSFAASYNAKHRVTDFSKCDFLYGTDCHYHILKNQLYSHFPRI